MRKTLLSFAASAALLIAPALSSAASYTFSGSIGDGPLIGEAFTGSFEFDASGVTPLGEALPALTSFSMQLFGQTYTLATADATAFAVFFEGSFLGLSFVDADAPDLMVRPAVSLVPGFDNIAEAYLGYYQSPDPGAGLAGTGSFNVAVVPEPATMLLMLAGLGVVCGMARRWSTAAS